MAEAEANVILINSSDDDDECECLTKDKPPTPSTTPQEKGNFCELCNMPQWQLFQFFLVFF